MVLPISSKALRYCISSHSGHFSWIVNQIAYFLHECLQFCCHLSDTIRKLRVSG